MSDPGSSDRAVTFKDRRTDVDGGHQGIRRHVFSPELNRLLRNALIPLRCRLPTSIR